MLSSGIAYPASLTRHVMDTAAQSRLVQDQLADPQTNVLNGEPFGTEQTTAVDMASSSPLTPTSSRAPSSSTPASWILT